ncbi:MAG TPA: cytochrome c [Verrucomicrobiota bacterium]|nr:cytochrome c [Verrucomicrobiota bacterium]
MNHDPKSNAPDNTSNAEPAVSMTTLPVWILTVMLVLLFLGAWHFDLKGGWFDSKVYGPYTSLHEVELMQPPSGDMDLFALGMKVYNKPTCVACHQSHGKGTPGQFPPLVGVDWVLEPDPGRLIRIVLGGLQGPMEVQGQQYNNAMVPWKDVLSDLEVAAVLTYIRQEWGNNAPDVTPEQVKAVREKTKDRMQPWTAPELLKISPAD